MKSILGLCLAISIAIFMTSCEQTALNNVSQELANENTNHEDACAGCIFSNKEPDELVDVMVIYTEGEEPVARKAMRYEEDLIIDGDIILSSNYSEDLALRGNVFDFSATRWPNSTIPYVIGPGFPSEYKNTIREAIKHVNEKTNLCIVERTNETEYMFFETSTGCSATKGRVSNGRSKVRLSPACTSGIIIHEILHVAGLAHEHQRDDRDDFITVNFDNLGNIPGTNHSWATQFALGDSEPFGPYDFASIMHYPPQTPDGAGTIDDDLPMFTVNNPADAEGINIGQRNKMSNGDIETVNILYPNSCGGCPNNPNAPALSDLRANPDCDAVLVKCFNNSGDKKRYQLRTRSGTLVENKTSTRYSRVFKNLSPDTKYKFRVKKQCGTTGAYGPWSDYKNFRTKPLPCN